jgi:hypothetical protein
MSDVYVIIGESEEVGQRIAPGGNFRSSYIKKVIGYVDSLEEAEAYIKLNKLKAPARKRWSDGKRYSDWSGTKNYIGGYFEITYEIASKLQGTSL